MKKFLWVVLACMVFAVPSFGQFLPSADVSAGYSFTRFTGNGATNVNGFAASAALNPNRWLGVVADFDVSRWSGGGASATITSYTFGPRLSLRNMTAFTPFVEGLAGGSHWSAAVSGLGSGSINPFTYGFGGGVEYGRRIALRPQVDYMGYRINGQTQNSVRVAVSLVFRIGSK